MPTPSDMQRDPSAEAKYRHGFTHGVETTLAAVDHLLSEADRTKLAKWRDRLLDWRMRNDSTVINPPAPPALEFR